MSRDAKLLKRKPPEVPGTSSAGRLQQVDASIRYKVGTVEILITIECRKRSRKENDTWVEQLATRRAKLGAAKTIAVSARGFSQPAKQTAAHYGIELRTLSEVSAADIEDWFLPGVVNVFRVFDAVRCWISLFDAEGRRSETGYDVDAFAPTFYSNFIHSPFPATTLLHLLERVRPDEFVGVPPDGTKAGLETGITWAPGELQVATSEGREDVAETRFLVVVHYESRVCDLESGTHHVYSDAEGKAVQRSSFETELFGGSAQFEFQSTDGDEPAASWSFKPPGARPEDPPSLGPMRPQWAVKLPRTNDEGHE